MYTQQPGSAKPFHSGVQGALNRSQNRSNGFVSGKNRQLHLILCVEKSQIIVGFGLLDIKLNNTSLFFAVKDSLKLI